MQQEIERLETIRAVEKDIFVDVVQKFVSSLEYEKIKEKRDGLKLMKQIDKFVILDRFVAQHDLVI
jgi:hypothetical protein